jgi:glutamate racemase
LLACTHYPLIEKKIKEYLPGNIQVVSQGDIVAHSLVDYLQRHPEMEQSISRNKTQHFFTTTDDTEDFDHYAELFFSAPVKSGYAEIKC